jgi:hypothetical protein
MNRQLIVGWGAVLLLGCGNGDDGGAAAAGGSVAAGGSGVAAAPAGGSANNVLPGGGAAGLAGSSTGGSSGGIGAAGGGGCPAATPTSCSNSCVDTTSDASHCGGCNQPCASGMSCVAGKCECSSLQSLCGGSCRDLQADAQNCGRCDNACAAGLICRTGACACAEGKKLCGESCADTQLDPANCGACGTKCGIGKTCTAGSCVTSNGGDPGPDGCAGLAANVTLSGIYAYQTLEVPVMKDGVAVAASARKTDIVAGRDTLFRLFVTLGSGWTSRSISGRFFVDNEGTVDVYSTKKSPTKSSVQAELDSTFQVSVPKDKITKSTTFQVELVECGTSGGTPGDVRFPADAATSLGARTTGPLKIKVIPLVANGMEPDTSDSGLAPYKANFLAMYPIPSVEISVGSKLNVSDDGDWVGMLDDIRAKRQTDKPANDVYYYGLLKPTATLREYCGGGCTAGIGYVVGQGSANQQAQQRASLGLAYGDLVSANTMAHEIGHNHGRGHAPCVPRGGSIDGVDGAFPYDGGQIGVYGWDMRTMALLPPTRTDIMGYCDSVWISDYTYDALLTRVASVNGVSAKEVTPASSLRPWRVVLIDHRGVRWGKPISTPALPSGNAELAEALDGYGNVIDVVEVYRTEISDIDAFSIEVPEPEPGWAAIRVSGAAELLYP